MIQAALEYLLDVLYSATVQWARARFIQSPRYRAYFVNALLETKRVAFYCTSLFYRITNLRSTF